jgi:hypothetical protein
VKSFLWLFCILAPLTNASAQSDVLKAPCVQAQMSKLYADTLRYFVPAGNGPAWKAEWSFVVNLDGAPGRSLPAAIGPAIFCECNITTPQSFIHTHSAQPPPLPRPTAHWLRSLAFQFTN